ncbi:MAG TPA: cytochrome ubiquinol oxidase subunit I [Acidobacteriota bacterium]|nr:cytochrome ubiquinol oxidase subunit I [Acidobacteriota bacterium]HNT16596.1 cytochrome ubiquinol oxidase subunit I [Acidobacteriota bacterium]HQO19941.1 cytochrome ubiquinol oxidase subunit I [Acidobacteriota bacterium]HQQ46780.1 cytochrome ubiquinol oxidase subunit I [Acidobacteriota bacterium]
MDALMLARLQFAVTCLFHFIFVPLTLGLSVMVAVMETLYVRRGEEKYLRMTKFWGKLFLINFALGVVTGITMEFQFGMNWAEYSKYVGDIFGAPLAIEATVAFFLESTFIGLWVFSWEKVSKKMHATFIWLVAFGTNMSALWILLANAWMQKPVGYVLRNGRAEMSDFGALVFNPYGWLKFLHTNLSGYVIAAFFVMGISAYHLLKKNETEFFRASFRIAAVFGFISSLGVAMVGDLNGQEVARYQPAKFAAMESHWETRKGAPMALLQVPLESEERNAVELIKIPKMLSILATHDPHAEIKGLKDIPKEDRPPVTITFFSFRIMVGLGTLFILLSGIALYLSLRNRLEGKTLFLRILLYSIPLPYIAAQLGWIVAEVGRQPWIVYGLMRTKDAISRNVSAGQVLVSLLLFTFFYGILGVVDIYLMYKFGKKGPEPLSLKAEV